jgi:hypothetical protein
MRLPFLLLIKLLLLLPLRALVLCLVINIRTLCNKMSRLTTFEAHTLPLDLFLLGVLIAFLQSGLEALDHKRHLIFIEVNLLNLRHRVRERLLNVRCFESDSLRIGVVRETPIGNVVNIPRLLGHHTPAHEFYKDFLRCHLCVPSSHMNQVYNIRIKNGKWP